MSDSSTNTSDIFEDSISPRRYDIDWLRIIAIALLIFFHAACMYQPWATNIGFIQSEETSDLLWRLVSIINYWRIPLLFTVSGMGLYLAMTRRKWLQLLGERSQRILVPLLFGSVALVPINIYIFQLYYGMETAYFPFPQHLWFLANIYIYVLMFLPLFVLLRSPRGDRVLPWVKKCLCNRAGLYILALPLVLESHIFNPSEYAFYAYNDHGFWLGAIVFVYGFVFLWIGDDMRALLRKLCYFNLGFALILYLSRVTYFDLSTMQMLASIESFVSVLAALGLADRFLNRPSRLLSQLTPAAYPVYILHLFFLLLGAYLLFPLDLPIWVSLPTISLLSYLGSYAVYYAIVNRIVLLQLLFGIKPRSD